MRRSHRRAHTAEVATIKQIRVAIFAQCQHQAGRRGAGYIQEHWAGAAQVNIPVIETLPVRRRPVIAGRTGKDRPGLETNNRFATAPNATCVEGIAGGNVRHDSVISDPADSPYASTCRCRRPGHYAARIIYRHTDQPAMIISTISEAPAVGHIKNVADYAKRGALTLHR